MTTTTFTIAEEVRAFGVVGAVFTLRDLRNRATDPAFAALKAQTLDNLRRTLMRESLQADPVLAGFRRLHTALGISNKRNVAAPEALLKLLLETGRFPHINLLVDLYNLYSLRTRLSLGAHDLAHISGNVQLRLTDGSEHFLPMGAGEPRSIAAGEYAYADDRQVLCRLEVRQCDATKVTLDTTDALVIMQGNAATPPATLHAAMRELIALLQHYCGGEAEVLWTDCAPS